MRWYYIKIKQGSLVTRKSYQNDIVFKVSRIIGREDKAIAILKGISIRIEADSSLEDLVLLDKNETKKIDRELEEEILTRIGNNKRAVRANNLYIGRILHLDGDKRYSLKSAHFYRRAGLDAIAQYIPERMQSRMVIPLLQKYNPDILIITGHDAMYKKGSDRNNIYNYRNSANFIRAVKEARRWGPTSEQLVIFAGACQSFYEAIMMAGADFASSPARILIDFIDPLILAELIAKTDGNTIIHGYDIANRIKEGKDAINGNKVRGKRRIIESSI